MQHDTYITEKCVFDTLILCNTLNSKLRAVHRISSEGR
jgi:hypothetical protein